MASIDERKSGIMNRHSEMVCSHALFPEQPAAVASAVIDYLQALINTTNPRVRCR